MVNHYSLNNGISVVTEHLPHCASASAGVWVRAGSVDEDCHAGISHFVEHMLFKGTARRSYRQISEDIEKLGGQVNAFTMREATCYYVKTLSEHLAECLDVLADMLTGSALDPAEMEKEKGVIIEEIKMIEDVPDEWGGDVITEFVFKGGTLERRVIGTKESVSAIGRDDLAAYIAQRYTADSIVISVSGQFDEAALAETLESLFGGIGGTAAPRVFTPDAGVWTRESFVREIEQTHLFFGTKGTKYLDGDLFAHDLYCAVLGGGMSSRLFMSVREEQGLAYSIYSAHSPYVDDGQFVVYAGVSDDKAEAATEAIKAEILRLADGGVGEDELSRVREQYKCGYIFKRESSSSRMFATGRNYLLLGRVFTEDEVLGHVNAVGADDIRRVAQQYADFGRYAAVSVSSRSFDLDRMLG